MLQRFREEEHLGSNPRATPTQNRSLSMLLPVNIGKIRHAGDVIFRRALRRGAVR